MEMAGATPTISNLDFYVQANERYDSATSSEEVTEIERQDYYKLKHPALGEKLSLRSYSWRQ